MGLDPTTIRALTFDVFGTVVDWRSSIAAEVDALARERGFDVDGACFADAWRARYQPAMERVRRGEVQWSNLDALHRANLDEVLESFGMAALEAPARETLNLAWHRLDPWPDSVPGLTRLKQRYILATLSNGNVALLVNMAKRGGLPWDAVLGAEVAGHYKPQPEAYEITARLLGLRPDQCLMVAAHNSDLVAASASGYRTAFVCRPTECGPGQDKDLLAEHDFDIVSESMVGLAQELQC